MRILLEHVRCFSKRQSISLRPLTLLVGENSSGKSTCLAMVSSVFDRDRFPGNPAFNEPPYNLGTFDTIATHKGGRYGRDDYFVIGFSEFEQGMKGFREVTATFGSEHGNTVLRAFRAFSAAGELSVTVSESTLSGSLTFGKGNGQPLEPIEFKYDMANLPFVRRNTLALDTRFIIYVVSRSRRQSSKRFDQQLTQSSFRVLRAAEPPYESCFSFAPIRSKPRRTYDELSEEYSPEGDHIPTLLARLLKEETTSQEGRRVEHALRRFGMESGLFEKIDVKRLGKKVSDPFQIQIAVAGPSVNLADVGYGVSQALPIVVQSVLRTTSKVLLLQQPEVHLHPRAQAALGSFFSELAADDDRMILIETHSDNLVDRVRQEVTRGTIPANKVLILFFHKPHLETTVHPITLDSHGNVENAPPCYREFFLKEELDLLSRTSS